MTWRILQSPRGRLLVLFTHWRAFALRLGPGKPLAPLGIGPSSHGPCRW